MPTSTWTRWSPAFEPTATAERVVLVVDASAAYRMLFTGFPYERISDTPDLVAPDLIVPELLNARWKNERLGARVPGIDDALKLLAEFRLVPSLQNAREAAGLASELDHPVYDCFYAALARASAAPVMTADRRFARKLQGIGFSVIAV